MRTKEEVMARLRDAEERESNHLEWLGNARRRYNQDLKNWGEADYGEVLTANEAYVEAANEVTILKWFLNMSQT